MVLVAIGDVSLNEQERMRPWHFAVGHGGPFIPRLLRSLGSGRITGNPEVTNGNLRVADYSHATADDAPELQVYRPISGERIGDVVVNFVAHPPLKLRKKSVAKYRSALQSFGAWTKHTHVSQLPRDDIKKFMSHLVNVEGLDPSTAIDKAVICLSVMNEHGAQIKMKRGDWPWVTERQPDIYNPEITQRLFAAADERQFALFTADELVGRQIGFLPLSTFFVTNPLGSPKLKLDERFRLKSPADCGDWRQLAGPAEFEMVLGLYLSA